MSRLVPVTVAPHFGHGNEGADKPALAGVGGVVLCTDDGREDVGPLGGSTPNMRMPAGSVELIGMFAIDTTPTFGRIRDGGRLPGCIVSLRRIVDTSSWARAVPARSSFELRRTNRLGASKASATLPPAANAARNRGGRPGLTGCAWGAERMLNAATGARGAWPIVVSPPC